MQSRSYLSGHSKLVCTIRQEGGRMYMYIALCHRMHIFCRCTEYRVALPQFRIARYVFTLKVYDAAPDCIETGLHATH